MNDTLPPLPVQRRSLLKSGAALAASGAASTALPAQALTLDGSDNDVAYGEWDYVIVGAGSAGCVLAARLSENGRNRVLLIEAGTEPRDAKVFYPPVWPFLAGGEFDWKYHSTPQAGLKGRSVPEPRGKGLGGSSIINAMGFQRGATTVYDHWGRITGDSGWSYAGLLPYFKRSETCSTGGDAYRGDKGPLHVLHLGHVPDQSPFAKASAQAGISAGYPLNPDWNGAQAGSSIWAQLAMRGRSRETGATAYLNPARARSNLHILTGAHVQRIEIKHGQCKGVEYLRNGQTHVVRPIKETILAAGAFDTPRLLMLSGIGDAPALKALGIKSVSHIPAVGKNLADHPLVPGLLFQARRPLPLSYYNNCETMVIAQSKDAAAPNLQLMILSIPFLSPDLGAPPENTFSIVPSLLDPHSRGEVRLTSSDPSQPMAINPGYLTEERDVMALVEGFEISRKIAAQPAFEPWIEKELFPGPATTDRAKLGDYIRKTASPFFHPPSTCRMGARTDRNAVVDPQCRVRGIENLRIVDASILPTLPYAMPNAAIVAVAERASDIILGLA